MVKLNSTLLEETINYNDFPKYHDKGHIIGVLIQRKHIIPLLLEQQHCHWPVSVSWSQHFSCLYHHLTFWSDLLGRKQYKSWQGKVNKWLNYNLIGNLSIKKVYSVQRNNLRKKNAGEKPVLTKNQAGVKVYQLDKIK